ncbi:T9SS type A sorting domain-containing protein [Flavobacterium sp. 3HN19-14]|uniref:T9SS type A sorting domain-containing protein n=1 Tax=Flavobacterium sp. 3HN19-14 TaxID=3448133 RepID=UPI003EDFB1D8
MKQLLLFTLLLHSQFDFSAIITPPPTASAQNFCDYTTVSQLVANGSYIKWYENENGGSALNPDTQIFTGIYYASQTLNNEESTRTSVDVIVNTAPIVDELGVVYGCHSYALPSLNVGVWFGNQEHTEAFNPGDVFDISRNLFIFAENECGSAESWVSIIIESELELPFEENIETCGSYFLPDFSEGGYYTQSGGNGAMLSGGEEITMSQTLYKYAVNSCGGAQTILHITINQPAFVAFRDDVYTCGSYVLPPISSGNYYTASNTGGQLLQPGTVLTTSQLIYMYAGNGCGDAESSFYVNIADTIDTTLNVSENQLTSNQQNAAYQWWTCNENPQPVPDATGQIFAPESSGIYSVLIMLGDCSLMSECMPVELLNISDIENEDFIIYPNPAKSTIQIKNLKDTAIQCVKISDMSGKIVFRQDFPSGNLNIEKLSRGVYIVQLISNDKNIIQKFIKN